MALNNSSSPQFQTPVSEPAAQASVSGWGNAKADGADGAADGDYIAKLIVERFDSRPALKAKLSDLFASQRYGASAKAVLVKVPFLGMVLAYWGILAELAAIAREYWAKAKEARSADASAAGRSTVEGQLVKSEPASTPAGAPENPA
jgi:hypothetical protein